MRKMRNYKKEIERITIRQYLGKHKIKRDMASIYVPFSIKQVGNFLRHFWDFFIDNHSVAHKVYENKLNQDFNSAEINQKWCTDFTYLFLTDGSKRYNCTIIDLHDRSVVASITD